MRHSETQWDAVRRSETYVRRIHTTNLLTLWDACETHSHQQPAHVVRRSETQWDACETHSHHQPAHVVRRMWDAVRHSETLLDACETHSHHQPAHVVSETHRLCCTDCLQKKETRQGYTAIHYAGNRTVKQPTPVGLGRVLQRYITLAPGLWSSPPLWDCDPCGTVKQPTPVVCPPLC
jgi:hypothetical protein